MPHVHSAPHHSPSHLQVPASRIARCVREMLDWRAPFDASGITVEAEHGVVTLRGTVARPEDAREARRLAQSVLGVHEVRDLMTVLA